jgi:hypothetical protein
VFESVGGREREREREKERESLSFQSAVGERFYLHIHVEIPFALAHLPGHWGPHRAAGGRASVSSLLPPPCLSIVA